jgi:ferredoxin-type protein NapG
MTNGASQRDASSIHRRQFLADTVKAACGVGIFGVALGLYSNQAKSTLPTLALRPPGALDESKFLSACVRCGLCVRDCPYDTLKLAKAGDSVTVGTPYFVARNVPCEMCTDIPCVVACPTGALVKSLKDIKKSRMGLAVLIDHETCLNYLGLRCDVCYRVCPVIDKAITLERRHNERTGKHTQFIPTVHSDHCTGCGKCEKSCVLDKAAIRVVPVNIAKGKIHEHYKLGWVEKEKHGGQEYVPGLIKMPTRMPEQ